MTFDGTGTRGSPIFIQDSEEENIQELSSQQFYGSSSTGKDDMTPSTHHSTHQHSNAAGKRKCREEDEPVADACYNTLPTSTSLENRISQPEGKKARKRRRRAEREALERNKSRSIDWLDSPNSFLPPPGPSQPAPTLQARLNAERQYSEFLDGVLRMENQADMVFHDYGLPLSSTFDSDWVSSMVIAGEFSQCKKVKTSLKASPHPPSRQLPAFPPSLAPPEVLPPIHINPDLMVSTEAPTPTHSPQEAFLQIIGMKPEQDPDSKHGIFHATNSTKEAGSGMRTRKNPYIPDPARTLVMEKLPKGYRTGDFVNDWCFSAAGVSALHVFVDPPSGKALIEFDTADLARKAWASPRLGQNLLALVRKPHLLKRKPREDLIKVWWYRFDGVAIDTKAAAGVGDIEEGEIEEGEIEDGGVTENQMQIAPRPPHSPRESKRRKAKSAKERETKATTKENQKQQKKKQKKPENSSALVPTFAQPAPTINVSTPAQAEATPSQVHVVTAPKVPPAFPIDPITGIRSLYPPTQPWLHPAAQVQPPVFPYSATVKTEVGSSLAPGAGGGHDDSASIASSGGRSSPECHWSRRTAAITASSKIAVVATTVGQADDLADYSEVDLDVESDLPRDGVGSVAPTSKEAISPTAIQAHQPFTKKNALALQPVTPTGPRFISGKLRQGSRSKQRSQAQSHPRSYSIHTPTLAYRPAVPPFIFKNHSSHQPQQRSPVASLSASLTPGSHVSNASRPTPFSSIPSMSVPIPTAHASLISGPNVAPNFVHPKHAASVRSKSDKQISSNVELIAAGGPTAPASPHPAPSPSPIVPASVAPSSSSIDSEGQAMEENLRQLVFASKRARASGVQPQSSSSQCHTSISEDVNMVPDVAGKSQLANDRPSHAQSGENDMVNPNTETSVSAPSSATIPRPLNSTSLNQPTADTFTFEDLAITFITQTIENVKANNNNQSVDSSPLTSASRPPLAAYSSANLSKSELSAKQRRLEKHLQESKSLMERLSTAKTKREKDLLLKIMNEKMRLFEEENKASDKTSRLRNPGSTTSISIKKPTKSKTQTTTVLHFQQWPTTQSNPILVLSDDED